MEGGLRRHHKFDRLLMLPVVGALIGIWALLAWFTISERAQILERVQGQLASTIGTLADFSELEQAAEASNRGNIRSGGGGSAAIWRALLQYPSASIWMATDGVTTVGEPPPQDGTPDRHAPQGRAGRMAAQRTATCDGHAARYSGLSATDPLPRSRATKERDGRTGGAGRESTCHAACCVRRTARTDRGRAHWRVDRGKPGPRP